MSRQEVWVKPLRQSLAERAKQSFATRRVPREAMVTLVGGAVRPRSGDVVLARIARLGHHKHIEQPHGRRSVLHEGDLVVLAYADRYATDQFESYVPFSLGPCHMVASGGIASRVRTRSRAVRPATSIVPLGLVGDAMGRPVNVSDFRLEDILVPKERPRTVAVMGTSMNAGKTTTVHHLLHGLARAGARPGATKVTGTGSGNDYWVMLDAGAHMMLDFTDAGLAATFQQPIPVLERAMAQLVGHLAVGGCGVTLMEIADGVFQQENRRLLVSPLVHDLVDTVILAASDAMGAAQGVRTLTEHGFDVCAVSGLMTKSPLAVREAEAALGLPVLGIPELQDPAVVGPIIGLDMSLVHAEPELELPAWPVSLSSLEDDHTADGDERPDDQDHGFPGSELVALDARAGAGSPPREG
ncbi:DUF1611 domain-containing protein [Oryzobacter telluris]|uniref:DUF1611 domain-containing protein n=1 Tax=Oryzobacter telluris TaxID=3149179 RepID=UPI00370D6034